MKTPDQIAAEAAKRIHHPAHLPWTQESYEERLLANTAIIKAAIEEALSERPDGMKSGGVQRMDEQLHPTSIPPQMP